MMDVNIKATTNWNLLAGTDVAKAVQIKIPTAEDFVKPHLDDIISSERAILLDSGTNTNQPSCELKLEIFPKYKISSLSLASTSPKIELFIGSQLEYVETIYGEQLDDEDNCDDIPGYRYDVEISKSGVTHLMLKIITPSNEVCIYGVQLNVAPNPNGITTLLPSKINLDNVKELLNNSTQKLSPSAEKCKMFLETYKNAMNGGNLVEQLKNINLQDVKDSKLLNCNNGQLENGNASFDIKSYIDEKIQESERRILDRVDAMEETLNKKLDIILMKLQ